MKGTVSKWMTLLPARILKAVGVTLTDIFPAGSGQKKETVSKSVALLLARIKENLMIDDLKECQKNVIKPI